MNGLYPLKFKPQYFDKIWGGQKIKTVLGKDFGNLPNCGESWEISGVEGNVSVVANGFLAGNNLEEVIEIYMGDLIGEKNYEKFGVEFPLLIKFIDANSDLSIQVHPDDKIAKERHNAYGKTEMWYVIDAGPGAKLNSGFNRKLTKAEYLEYFNAGKILDILSFEEVKKGDVFFIPAGRVHAIGARILVAEIQQTSDITYRIFDFNRVDENGNGRELHTELALDAIKFESKDSYKTQYEHKINETVELESCKYFTTNLLEMDKEVEKDFYEIDTFVIYMCIEGSVILKYKGISENIKQGETILVPAAISSFILQPLSETAKLLEVYIK
ncbi:MAG: class I mannose-6-phosphate isomerase [Prolixibacteraceae bacterium]|nr:class I mannose-6-phosphate isomerase [Prolixibacteraceae bacterium]